MKLSATVDKYLGDLVAQGVLPAEVVKSLVSARPQSKSDRLCCLACHLEAADLDYVCGDCSNLKVASEREFWQRFNDKEAGRPVVRRRKSRCQRLPPRVGPPARKIVDLPDLPAPTKTYYEFAVTAGLVTVVVVAEYRFEAASTALWNLRLPKRSTTDTLCLGETQELPTERESLEDNPWKED